MEIAKNGDDKRIMINESDIPLESNLGLLAYGDLAFTAWRKIKAEKNKNNIDGKK